MQQYGFFVKAMQANGIPEKVTMQKSGTNNSAFDQVLKTGTLRLRFAISSTSTESLSQTTE